MKKLFPLLLLVLCSFTMNAQLDTIVTPNIEISTAERVVDKYADKAYGAVKELANALKVPAEHVYTVLVKQAVVVSITWIITFIILIIISILCIKTISKYGIQNNDYEIDQRGMAGMIIGIFTGIGVIICFTNIDIMVGGLLNPEYYAIQEILDTFK